MTSIYDLPDGKDLDERLHEAVYRDNPAVRTRLPREYSHQPGAAIALLEAAMTTAYPRGIEDVHWSYQLACDGYPPEPYSCKIGSRSPISGPTLPLAICRAVASFCDLA